MDVFDGPYYRINKYLLTFLGQWPYQKPLHKRIIRIALLLFSVSVIVPEIIYMMAVWGDLDYVIESGSAFGVEISNGIKLSNYIFNADKMKMLLNRIRDDWKVNMYDSELTTLKKYADKGRRLTEFYCVYMYSTMATYLLFPVMPKFLDLVMPLNESRPGILPLPIKYGNLELEQYYFPMMLHTDCIVILTITTIVTMDTTYVVYVQHACGIFATIGDRLERLVGPHTIEELDEASAERQEEATYQEVVSCVKMHSAAIEFANAVESTYVVVFFFVMGLSVFCMSVAGYQTVMNLDRPNEAVRFATFTIAQVAHIFFICWPGQNLIDHSERIHELVYGSQWFEVSARSKKLLKLMMLRSIKPCSVTAGRLYTMSLANFSLVVKTSVSYFTVLTSFR